MMTGVAYPQIRFYRGNHVKPNQYFGPFPSAWAVREAIGHIQRIFGLRTCDDTVFNHRSRPCLLHQIGRCSAPCVQKLSVEQYAQEVNNAALFLRGKQDQVTAALTEQMEQLASELKFEEAALVRNQIRTLQRVLTKQFVETQHDRDVDVVTVNREQELWCVNLVMIRGGRHLGDRSFFPQNVHESDANEVLEAFISQHYSDQLPPAQVFVNIDVDHEALSELLTLLAAEAGGTSKVMQRTSSEARNWILMSERNAKLAMAKRLADAANQEARLKSLQSLLAPYLQVDRPINRIECFDNSHTMGEAFISAVVVYADGKMQPSQYRRFNVRGVTPGDDFGAMRFALQKRYGKHAVTMQPASEDAHDKNNDTNSDDKTDVVETELAPLPDLVLIDGGLGQLNMARAMMEQMGLGDVPLVGVAKGPERKAGMEELVFSETQSTRLASDTPGLHLIQQIRDESHRFAITGHRAKRDKARVTSQLQDVGGIGPKRRQALLKHFGGLQGVKTATVDDLAKVEGISLALAQRIFDDLHKG
jgi:excinuclease ABC subunit C